MMAPVLFPIDLGATDITNRLKRPSFMSNGAEGHILGTDSLGRDFFIRLVYGTRNSLMIGLSSMLIAAAIGTILGVLSRI